MAAESQREWLNLEDGAASEANSSIQVHLDSRSVRGLSTSRTHRSRSRRRRSPSRNPDHPETMLQPSGNSQSQSSGLSSQPIHDTPLPQEDLLIDLISPTEPGSSSVDDLFHGLKRPHDGETTGEPSPKRDKLGEELEQMMADAKKEEDQPATKDNDAVHEPSISQSLNGVSGPSTMTRKVLPIRHARKTSTTQSVQRESEQQQGGSSTPQNSSNSSTPKPRTPQGPPQPK
ncbi:hypothetical protein V8F33_002550 [Rhypophila sp. PSN 637]